MKLHGREMVVSRAENELEILVINFMDDKALTDHEALRVATCVLSRIALDHAKYGIRKERHGRTDIPGGLEEEE